MTRLNSDLDPRLLKRMHLLAELREITMVPASLRRSLRNKGLEPVIKKVFETEYEIDAYNEETRLIMLYGRRDIDINGVLTNICEDNRPPKRTKPLTAEHKNKISDAHKGHTAYKPDYKHSEETKKKIKESNKASVTDESRQQMSLLKKGKTFSDEHKKKLSEAHKGRKLSEETKQKMRESHMKRNSK